MPHFSVRCYERGIWDGVEPHKIETQNEQEAAESICGAPLIEGGKPGQLRAIVWPTASPDKKKTFFVPH